MDIDDLKYSFAVWSFKSSVPARMKLWRKLAKLLHNGISMISALTEIRDRAEQSFGPNHKNVVALSEWIDGLNNGDALHDVVAEWVSLEEILLIKAGEESGDMSGAFTSVDLVMTSKRKIAKQVKSAMRKPIIYFFGITAFVLNIAYTVIPKFEMMMRGHSFTGAAAATVEVAAFARHWMAVVVIAVIAVVIAITRSLPTWDGPLRVKFDQYPPFSLYRLITGSAWVISLSALVKGGIKIADALEKIEESSTPWLAERTRDCIVGIGAGISIGDALFQSGKGFPDREVIDDLLIYSKQKDFDKALHIIGGDMLEDTEEKIAEQAAILDGIVMMIAGLVLIGLYGGVFAMQQQMTAIFSGG